MKLCFSADFTLLSIIFHDTHFTLSFIYIYIQLFSLINGSQIENKHCTNNNNLSLEWLNLKQEGKMLMSNINSQECFENQTKIRVSPYLLK